MNLNLPTQWLSGSIKKNKEEEEVGVENEMIEEKVKVTFDL